VGGSRHEGRIRNIEECRSFVKIEILKYDTGRANVAYDESMVMNHS
jgi:hypothetical protein